MGRILFALPENENLGKSISQKLNTELGEFEFRHFPDGESYIRILSEVQNKEAIVVCTLNQPDQKILPLLFLCNLLKDMKVKSICLVAPYLAYMRQDKKFKSGEAVTSEYFAKLISSLVDRLITIDPHLHRRHSMSEIYSIPCTVLHASEYISKWINENVKDALLIGPDSESEQWVSEVAKNAHSPFVILEKTRLGDRDVKVSVPHVEKYKDFTPVLVDDIISTARTMIETVGHIKHAGMKPPICIGVHPVFAGNSYYDLLNTGVKKIITSNTIKHPSNEIDLANFLVAGIGNMLN